MSDQGTAQGLVGSTRGVVAASAMLALAVLLLHPAATRAERPPDVDAGRTIDDSEVVGQLLGDVALVGLGEDLFLQLTLSVAIAYEGWRIVPRLPLRFRLGDTAPFGVGALRDQDWDEVGDFGRLLPHLSYARDGDLFHLRLGELPDVTVGFGELVDRYANTIDVDHYQTGVYLSVTHDLLGGQLLVDDVFDPAVAVVRLQASPLARVPGLPRPLAALQVGVTAGADFRTPLTTAVGKLLPLVGDLTRRVVVETERVVPLFGVDLALPLDLFDDDLRLTPYVALASLDFNSSAVHVGLAAAWRIDALSVLRLRGEYRYHTAGHAPGAVSTFYDAERLAYGEERTKRTWLEQLGAAGHGFLIEANLRLPPWIMVSVQLAHDTAGGTDLRVDVGAPNIGPVELKATLAALDVGGVGGSAASVMAGSRLMAAGQVRIRVLDWLYLRGALKSEWALTDLESLSSTPERYEGRLDTRLGYDLGVTGQLRF